MTNSQPSSITSERLSALSRLLQAEALRRRAQNRLKHYTPYARQKLFHDFGATCTQRLLRAGNQQGKTYSGAMEMAIHLTGRYPPWWQGRRFTHPIDAWAACDTGETTRDNPQSALMGPLGAWGTGAIPADALVEAKRGQGVADLLDTVLVSHASGGVSKLGFKRYDQGRQAWQGPSKHVIWCDEEPPEQIYNEALARLIATGGMVYTTFTPLLGMSSIVTRLMRNHDGTTIADVNMTIADALHIRPQDRAAIAEGFPEHERDARLSGIPGLGSGRIFPLAPADIRCRPFDVPDTWPVLGGMDFGYDHPFAAVRIAHDEEADCIYVTHAFRARNETPALHAAALRRWGRELRWAWPHDGLATEKGSGRQLMSLYEDEGLNMLPVHATHPKGGYLVEPGIIEMIERMRTGRFRVFEHLDDWFREFETYHRLNGKIVKRDDDLMSATRMAVMMLRHACAPLEALLPPPPGARPRDDAGLTWF